MSLDPLKCQLRAIKKDVLAYNMDMGEQVTTSGIVIQSDDGKAHGVKPRWCQVYKVGPEQTDVKVGDWILVEHGRWTRKIKIDDGESIKEIQKIEVKSIIVSADEKPKEVYIGQEFAHGSSTTIRPEDFGAR
jgi:hypothetical protein